MTIQEKYQSHFESLLRNNPKSFRLNRTEKCLIISSVSEKSIEILFFFFFLIIVPTLLIVYETFPKSIIIAFVWLVFFAYQFYQIQIGRNKLTINFQNGEFKIENISWPLMYFLRTRIIDINKTVDFEVKYIRISTYAKCYRIRAKNEEFKKITVLDFGKFEVAKRVKYLLKSIKI